ncbi:MAG: peptidylprolyl isomerase [Thiohalobacterales bacterium]|nr:peptidylprolyl isomerase [Thiohalobacterales bacterium]
MNYRRSALLLASILAAGATGTMTGCDQMQTSLTPEKPADETTAALTGDVVATVNGAPITQEVLDIYNRQRAAKGVGQNADDPDAALNELIALELMRQEAISKGADKDPVMIATLNQLQRSTLASAAIQSFMKDNEVSDDTVREAYDTGIGKPGTEYNARHILVETEEAAREIIGQLDAGSDFAELAKEKSTGPSGPAGGELGWFGAGQMVKPFSDATAALEKGSYTREPVQTQFGWHVIRLEDTREGTPPPFEDVKDRLKMVLTNQLLQQHVEQVRGSAEIEIK